MRLCAETEKKAVCLLLHTKKKERDGGCVPKGGCVPIEVIAQRERERERERRGICSLSVRVFVLFINPLAASTPLCYSRAWLDFKERSVVVPAQGSKKRVFIIP